MSISSEHNSDINSAENTKKKTVKTSLSSYISKEKLRFILKTKRFRIIAPLSTIFILCFSLFLWKRLTSPPIIFNLGEKGYAYQITKCWKTNPPNYWIKQFKTDDNKSIKIGKCTFQGTGAVRLKESNIDFDKVLDRNIVAQGELIKEKGTYYYLLTSAELEIPAQVIPSPKPEEKLIIKRITPTGEEIVYKKGKYDEHKILKWQNYLFFEPVFGYSAKEKLVRYNLDTGKTDIVYSENSTRRYLNYIQLIDNTLYFSVAGYLAGADTFWLDSPTSTPQKLIYKEQFGGSRIDFEYGRYWLKGGEGDACWGIGTYALFNPKTKIITPVATSYSGCGEGEEFIAIDSKDRMIMSYHKNKEGSKYPDEQIYEYVVAIPLDSPTNKQYLITKENMPTGIRGIKYSSESGQLALAGSELYLFDLGSVQLKKIVDFPNNWIGVKIYNWKNNQLCLSSEFFSSSDKKETSNVNLADHTIQKDTSYCNEDVEQKQQEQISYEEKKNKEIENLISKLNLPDNYKIVTEVSP